MGDMKDNSASPQQSSEHDDEDNEMVPLPENNGSDDDQGNDDADDDDDDVDDESSLLADVPFFDDPGQVPRKKLEQPPEGLQWKDDAILECFQLAVATHDQTTITSTISSNREKEAEQDSDSVLLSFEWSAPTTDSKNTQSPSKSSEMEFLSMWKPKHLPLPIWAVDPFAAAVATTAAAAMEDAGDSSNNNE